MARIKPGAEQAVVERELIGDVALKIHVAANGAARREQQMLMGGHINARAEIELGTLIGKVGLQGRLIKDLPAHEDVGQHLLLHTAPTKPQFSSPLVKELMP